MSESSFVLPADELARGAYNVAMFISTTNPLWSSAALRFGMGHLSITATDSIIAGQERLQAKTTGEARVCLSKSALEELDKAVRPDKKNPVRVEVSTEPVIIPHDFEDDEFIGPHLRVINSEGDVKLIEFEPYPESRWHALEEVFCTASLSSRTLPARVMLDAKRLSKFGRVKPDSGDRMMDLAFSDNYEPVLVKIGATFTGMIMPVHRETHAAVVGEEGLWAS